MSSIDHGTAVAFANAITRLRPTWQTPGIRAAIERAAQANHAATPSEILIAAIRLAGTDNINTPALLAEPGPWWDNASTDNKRPAWITNRVTCGVHPGQPLGDCEQCKADAGPELTPAQILEQADRIKKEIAAARATKRQQDADLATRQETSA